MICPNCEGDAVRKKSGFHSCNKCGAQEENLSGVIVWRLQSGRIVAAPQIEEDQLEKAKKNWPSGKWD